MAPVLVGGRWCVREGEEARLTSAGPLAAEIRSRGPLPLRVRQEALHHARPGFPGSAVVLGEETFEVVSEEAHERDDQVVYTLRRWPEGEVVRHRVVYGPEFVAAVEEQRGRQRTQARARPWRPVLYPLLGSLPEDEQQRACERLGLDPVVATCLCGLAEATAVFLSIAFVARHADKGLAILMVVGAPGLVFLILPGLGRSASALLFRETAGSPVVALALGLLRGLHALRPARVASSAPLTRRRFWALLQAADAVEALPGGAFLVRGRLPHLTWSGTTALQTGDDFWQVQPLEPERDKAGWLYRYRLEPLQEPGAAPPPVPPPCAAYCDEVMGQVRTEWDAFNHGFAALTSMLASPVQARAFGHRGGPPAVRRMTLLTCAAEAFLGAYFLSFLPGPAADPVAPLAAAIALALLADAAHRALAAVRGRYAPSLLRFLLPSNVLRPERVAYQAHRDADRRLDAEAAGSAVQDAVTPSAPRR